MAFQIISSPRLPATVVDNLGNRAEKLQNLVKSFNANHSVSLLASLRNTGRSTAAAAAPQQTQTTRAMCQPTFTPPDVPINPSQFGVPSETADLVDFQSKEFFGCNQRWMNSFIVLHSFSFHTFHLPG